MATFYLILALLGPLSWTSSALAQPVPAPEVTIAEVINLLIAQGFYDISKVEFDDDHYEIDAVNSNHEKVEIEMTGSGQFISIEKD